VNQKIKDYLFKPRFNFSRFQFNLVAIFFLFIGTTAGFYLTISKVFPLVFATNEESKQWTFNSSKASEFSYDQNLVVVDDNGAKIVAGVNKFSNPSFDSNNASWTVAAAPPTGWIEVPGNSSYTASNFLVMKYEAKCALTSNLSVGITNYSSGVYSGYSDSGSSDTSKNCTSANGKQLVSVASGMPVQYLFQSEAKTRCGSVTLGIGKTAHLIDNKEWMTIANNAEQQDSNWSKGLVGSGYLYAGHNDASPPRALIASENDSFRAAYTDVEGKEENLTSATFTGGGEYSSIGNQVRNLNLSNGAVIWDLAGNLEEMLSNTNVEKYNPLHVFKYDVGASMVDTTSNPATSAFQFNSYSEFYTVYKVGSSLSAYDFEPTNTSYTHSWAYGIGGYKSYTSSTIGNSGEVKMYLRGGGNDSEFLAGAFGIDLYYPATSHRFSNYAFRCTSGAVNISQTYSSTSGIGGSGGNSVVVGTISDAKIVQSINVGNTSSYNISAYVYNNTVGGIGGTINSDVTSLWYNGSAIGTTYTDVSATKGTGWWELSGTLIGDNSSREYGVVVKVGKTVKVDDFTLAVNKPYNIYTTTAYSNGQINTWDSFCEGTLSGTDCTTNSNNPNGTSITYQVCQNDGSVCEANSSWKYWDGDSWETATNTTTNVNTAAQLTQAAMQSLTTVSSKKISIKAFFNFTLEGSQSQLNLPKLLNITIGFTPDTTAPTTQASAIKMKINSATATEHINDINNPVLTKDENPYFSWTRGFDEDNGTGIKGYCLYLGQDESATINQASNLLNTDNSPISTVETNPECRFMVADNFVNFSVASLKGSSWLTSSSNPYYLKVWAADNSGNVQVNDPAIITFLFDKTAPTNVSFISPASGNFANVVDMNFSWPVEGNSAASDANSGLLGWQYQINSTDGEWKGTTVNNELGFNYIPIGQSNYTLDQTRDGGSIIIGNNVIYFRSIDKAGNPSSNLTIRTGNISYGGAAPSFSNTDKIIINPNSSETNSFALSWSEATPTVGRSLLKYFYMVNTPPPATYDTLVGNQSVYVDVGTSISVAATSLVGVNKGTNTVYVVAVDNAETPNYSPSNYISGTFTLNSTNPDNISNLVSSDSSIKSQSQWNVTLTWTAPTYQGAGNLTYLIYRSKDGINFDKTGSTSGLSYVDNAPSSKLYYYKIITEDGAGALSSGTNSVSITPTGKWTTSPTLESEPSVNNATTKKATITWSTSRTSDSKVQYGTTTGNYSDVEPSNSTQVSSHSIQLTGLSAGTTYYYRTKWTDEDGNSGTSNEKSFVTQSAPTVKNVAAKNVGLSGAIVQFTTNGASKAKIYYGTSTSFGGVKEIATSTNETTYTVELSGLDDGTKYYYKIDLFDTEDSGYEGTILDFSTLPRPKISSVRLEQIANTAQTTIRVTWETNTEVSSVITYYPEGDIGSSRDEVKVVMEKGLHSMMVKGLLPKSNYILLVKGRDKLGNEASSDTQKFTTATDTRPPSVLNLKVLAGTIPPVGYAAGQVKAQLIISWDTDELATSQVEFGEGAGTSYGQKSQEDNNLTTNHTVILSNLTPSQVYHFRVISKDSSENETKSIDTVTIAPKATKSAIDLVLKNLSKAFSFIDAINLK